MKRFIRFLWSLFWYAVVCAFTVMIIFFGVKQGFISSTTKGGFKVMSREITDTTIPKKVVMETATIKEEIRFTDTCSYLTIKAVATSFWDVTAKIDWQLDVDAMELLVSSPYKITPVHRGINISPSFICDYNRDIIDEELKCTKHMQKARVEACLDSARIAAYEKYGIIIKKNAVIINRKKLLE